MFRNSLGPDSGAHPERGSPARRGTVRDALALARRPAAAYPAGMAVAGTEPEFDTPAHARALTAAGAAGVAGVEGRRAEAARAGRTGLAARADLYRAHLLVVTGQTALIAGLLKLLPWTAP